MARYTGFERKFGGKKFDLYQANPVRKSLAEDIAQQVKDAGGKARIVESNAKGYYLVYARDMKD